jgi:iodothyronine deiodinase-like protein
MDSNHEEKLVFTQPKALEERRKLAQVLVDRLKYRMPVAIDGMDNPADKAFAAWPERIYLIGRDGRVLYRGEVGPFGFHPEEAERALSALLAPRTSSGG